MEFIGALRMNCRSSQNEIIKKLYLPHALSKAPAYCYGKLRLQYEEIRSPD